MDLYDIKKIIESVYYTHCIRQEKLPLPDFIYYHWDKRKLTKELIMENKERSPRKEKKKPKKEKR
jgi:hypothetical protein